jgi:hypothetical protein
LSIFQKKKNIGKFKKLILLETISKKNTLNSSSNFKSTPKKNPKYILIETQNTLEKYQKISKNNLILKTCCSTHATLK